MNALEIQLEKIGVKTLLIEGASLPCNACEKEFRSNMLLREEAHKYSVEWDLISMHVYI